MANRYKEMKRMVDGVLDEFGAVDRSYTVNGTSHARVDFTLAGQHRSFAFAASPGDRKTPVFTRCKLRRKLRGIVEDGAGRPAQASARVSGPCHPRRRGGP